MNRLNIIVTLTTIRSRLNTLRYTLPSLLDQTIRPSKIVINISREGYLLDEGIERLPPWLGRLTNNELSINWVTNTGPYRKLIPVLKEATSDDLIITCDDDVIYGERWLEYLVREAEVHPNAIICGMARQPVKNVLKRQQSYVRWPLAEAGEEGFDLVPIGVSGIAYRRHLIDADFAQNIDSLAIAPRQDDLWFKAATLLVGTPVRVALGVSEQAYQVSMPVALSSTNARVSRKYSWDQTLFSIAERVSHVGKAYFGLPVCDNDRVWGVIKAKYLQYSNL